MKKKETIKKYNYEDIAYILNNLYAVHHIDDDREFYFDTNRNSDILILRPSQQYGYSDFIDITPHKITSKYDAPFHIFVEEYLEMIIEEIEKNCNITEQVTIEKIFFYTWASYANIISFLEDNGFIVEPKYEYDCHVLIM